LPESSVRILFPPQSEVMIVEVGDFELTAPRGPQGRDDIGRLLVVEVKAGDRVTRGRLRRLLNDGAYATGQVKSMTPY
jgi:hypothetical protein